MFETETAQFNGVSHIAVLSPGTWQQPCWRVMVSVKDMVDEAIGEFGVCRPAMAMQRAGRPEKYHSRAEIISLTGDGFPADGNGLAHLEATVLASMTEEDSRDMVRAGPRRIPSKPQKAFRSERVRIGENILSAC